MKILIIRFSSIGDIVLCTPVIRACKIQLDAQVHFLTKARFRNLLTANPHLSKIHAFDKDLTEVKDELKGEEFDLIIDLHRNIRSQIVKFWLGKRSGTIAKLNVRKWLYVNFKINLLPEKHIVDRYFEASPQLKNDQKGLDFFIAEKDNVDLQIGKFICIVLGATYFTKRIPREIIEKIVGNVNIETVLIGGPDESKLGDEMASRFTHVRNACGQYSIAQSASIVSSSQLVITGDTGMMHIAAALKKPVLMLWGNTVREFGMGPYQTATYHFENNDLNCRPCSKLGKNTCPKGHFKCMLEQDTHAIINQVNKILKV